MREICTYGSVRGARSNARPYRDPRFCTGGGGAGVSEKSHQHQGPQRESGATIRGAPMRRARDELSPVDDVTFTDDDSVPREIAL